MTNLNRSKALMGNKNASKDGPNKAVTSKATPKVGGSFASNNKAATAAVSKAVGAFSKGTKTTSMETPQAYEKRTRSLGERFGKTAASIDKKFDKKVSKNVRDQTVRKVSSAVGEAVKAYYTKQSQYSKGRRDATARLDAVKREVDGETVKSRKEVQKATSLRTVQRK